jgi:N,N'-diacetylchitobiose transport system permease protein
VPARRRRRVNPRRVATPYLLLLPALAVIVAVLGYPLYRLVALSFQEYGLPELIAHEGRWIGLDNYATILGDRQFWTVLGRTVAFTAVTVGLTMVLGTLIALLLARLGRFMRLLITTGLVLVWSMPPVVSVNIWSWMVDYEFGVLNWTLTQLGLDYFAHHDWFVNPIEGFAVITAIVVWGAIPFVAITIFAGLTQVSGEMVEAASIDGAGGFRIFRDITLPILKPIFVILASLSVIWNFQVFSQIWIIRNARPEEHYFLLSIYSFVESFNASKYGLGSAIALVMVMAMLGVTFVYIRQMVRIGEID